MKRTPLVFLLALGWILLTGCGHDSGAFVTTTTGPVPTTAAPQEPSPALSSQPRVIGTIASGLAVPWGIAFLPDGSALVTERDTGRVLHIVGRKVIDVGKIDQTRAEGESGLLGIAVSPSYAVDGRIFVYTSTDRDNRILRLRFRDDRLSKATPILTGIPHGFIHDGGRLAFGPDGYLYVSTGETGDGDLAQRENSLGGKILRITQDGKPAPGNPLRTSPVWTLGHRNVQGLAFDPAGRLWASELGQDTWDELNLIQKGTNYGWPEVEGKGTQARFRNPVVVWPPQLASPSGLAYADGHLWMGALRGSRLWRIRVEGTKAVDPTDFYFGKYGRLRTVVTAPDGNLWVATSNRDGRGHPQPGDDRILLIRP